MNATSIRSIVLWVPDWPVVAAMSAAQVPAHQPAAVVVGNRMTAVSEPARVAGVRRAMRKRRARSLCPELELLPADDLRDARFFEPVAAAVEQVVAGLEIARPGLILLPAEGASRFHGSESILAERLIDVVTQNTGHECQVGIADGLLAAVLAARASEFVQPGESPNYLGSRPLGDVLHAAMTPERVTEVQALIDLWDRLGLRRMDDLAHLPRETVGARFGEAGDWVHRLVQGEDLRPPVNRRIEADVETETTLDPPAHRIDVAAFAARRLAEELHTMLVDRTASCGRLQISARTESGRELVRTWRTDDGALGGLTAARITDRVRWQLEGWLSGTAVETTDEVALEHGEPLVWLGLSAQDLVPAGAHQGRLWGGDRGAQLRAQRALERVQGLLGVDAVLTAQLQGGRGLRDQVHLSAWGDATQIERPRQAPWPGRLPEPAPASVLDRPREVLVLDPRGTLVTVDRRLRVSAEPRTLALNGRSSPIQEWAGPWPVAQRAWRQDAQRSVYLQAVLEDGRALLLSCAQGNWFLEAFYD